MIRYELNQCDGNIVVETSNGGGSVKSDLEEVCPYCKQPFCLYSCEQSRRDSANEELDGCGTPEYRISWNERIDGIERLILAAACNGTQIDSPEFQNAVQTALDACANYHSQWSV